MARYAGIMLLLVVLTACAPASWRMPGPLGGLGRGADEPTAEYLARRAGHAAPAAPVRSPRGRAAPSALAKKIAAAAEGFVGDARLSVAGEAYRFDCSGLVEASLAKAGAPWSGSSAMLHDAARDQGLLHRRHLPAVGDIAFFDDTYDRDGNGALDDALTHSAVVVGVDDDGTVEMVHVGSAGVVRLHMNLRHPHDRSGPDGALYNDYLRAKTRRDPPGTRYLAGELWVAFASFWAESPRVAAR